MAALESLVNVAVGYGLAVGTQALVFPWFGLHATGGAHLLIGLLFTVVSLARSYVLRRVFEAWRVRGEARCTEDRPPCKTI